MLTEIGAIDLDIPRDRNGSFEPQLVPKGTTRLAKFNENIVHLYARGMSTRDIRRELARMYGVEVSPALVSKVTDGILEELNDWQMRPLDAVYPIVYIDALVVKVRTDGTVINRAAYLGVGVDVEGRKHVLGVWLGDGDEGAKFWLTVLTELRHRGVEDVLLVCCDGLKGLPDAIEATWPKALVQTCVIHLIRASLRFCSWKDRKAITTALRPIYTAATLEAAEDAMDTFELEWGDRYPGIIKTWRSAWEQFTPFLRFPPEIRKVVYTTNLVESVNSSSARSPRPAATSRPTPRRSSCSAWPPGTSATSAAATWAPAPRAGIKHSTSSRSTSPDDSASPDPSTVRPASHTDHLTGSAGYKSDCGRGPKRHPGCNDRTARRTVPGAVPGRPSGSGPVTAVEVAPEHCADRGLRGGRHRGHRRQAELSRARRLRDPDISAFLIVSSTISRYLSPTRPAAPASTSRSLPDRRRLDATRTASVVFAAAPTPRAQTDAPQVSFRCRPIP